MSAISISNSANAAHAAARIPSQPSKPKAVDSPEKESCFDAFIRACCSCCRSDPTHYPARPLDPLRDDYIAPPFTGRQQHKKGDSSNFHDIDEDQLRSEARRRALIETALSTQPTPPPAIRPEPRADAQHARAASVAIYVQTEEELRQGAAARSPVPLGQINRPLVAPQQQSIALDRPRSASMPPKPQDAANGKAQPPLPALPQMPRRSSLPPLPQPPSQPAAQLSRGPLPPPPSKKG